MYFFGTFTVRAQRSEENHVLPSARKTVGAKSSEKGMLVVCVCVCVCSKNCADHGKAGTIQIQKYHSMGTAYPTRLTSHRVILKNHAAEKCDFRPVPGGSVAASGSRLIWWQGGRHHVCRRRLYYRPVLVHIPRSAPAGRLGAEREYVNDHALGSAPINPPAAKPPFCVRRRCKASTLRYVHTASPNVCPLPAGKKRRFADGVFMRADPSAKAAPPPRRTPCTLRRWRPQPGGGAPTSR